MNSVANGKIREQTPFTEVYIQPAAGDNGTALGAAFYVWHQMRRQPRRFVMRHGYWGPQFDDAAIEPRSLRGARDDRSRGGCTRSRIDDEPQLCEWTAARIADGKVVGWFQGRMEWGARALGNRSILADPRRARHARDHQHADQVPREVPAVRAVGARVEALDEYFVGAVPDPFMIQVYPVRPDKRAVDSRRHARRRIGPAADREPRDQSALLGVDPRVRQADRRADPAEHVLQRERADRADARRGARLLSADRHGRPRHGLARAGKAGSWQPAAGSRQLAVTHARFDCPLPAACCPLTHARLLLQPLLLARPRRDRSAPHGAGRRSRPCPWMGCDGCQPGTRCDPMRSVPASESRHGVRIVRAAGSTLDPKAFIGRATNYLTYFTSAAVKGLAIGKPDVVVALTDPPIIGLAALAAASRSGAPLVFLCEDIFPEVATLLEDFHSGTLNDVLAWINRFIVRKADRIIALGDTMKRRLVEGKGADPAKVAVIHNWADCRVVTPGPRDNAFRPAARPRRSFRRAARGQHRALAGSRGRAARRRTAAGSK